MVAAVIVLAALLVLSGILWYAEARYTAQALTPRLTRLSIPSQAVQESYTAEDGSVVIRRPPQPEISLLLSPCVPAARTSP